ncbi:M20 aminoacylase family protein [Rhodospirillum rubrum]|uniref:Peptidase M20D, amidohydrolase n=1 Tax=Rhodospirillum rubrum (strain ATCC 11170 / ATH 1.1.1 / DSM 467 / LMG 4362 / NCIMB 8255 / S1) TaxID=269796 RepID=Q2RQC7_RHORT|nr:M20 aminoacylase family protein [Rhodospirillum rubrum]ABC23668.1 Peptidase M20D, amidohydrolase [Rhodospirillum rubrum ATCC 11170]AEO49406.1 peptidase M20D, amidohydrolase [Rhodospirillum rubrum F11]MBK5955344.1 peptidase M20 [Rhodospirillum rubrum]QXG79628.1 amidohydrolase [Rhodospirillum rubrum]HAP98685.1 amidohydrolase [Rhodospirillum rubrum]
MTPAIPPAIAALTGDMKAWRHHLHAHPETAFEEHATADFIAGLLDDFGVEVHRGLAGTGVVGVIAGKRTGNRAIGLRADIDALHVTEATGLPHASVHAGRMHACGHDGHTAMLLGAAKHLAATRDFAGRLILIFQPAEENEGGGKVMVEEGLFDRFPVDAVYGMHNWPGLEEGHFALRTGPIMAGYDVFEITLTGKGGHAAMPHLGTDQLVAAGHLMTALQSIVARSVNPTEAAVVSVTQMHGGDTWNVLPASVVLRGTVRTFTKAVQDLIETRITELSRSIAQGFGAEAAIHYERRYPATVNSPEEAAVAARVASAVVGADKVDTNCPQTMGAEDFAFMLGVKPGAYVQLGAGPGRGGCMLHNPGYDFNDALLGVGASYWVGLVHDQLAG